MANLSLYLVGILAAGNLIQGLLLWKYKSVALRSAQATNKVLSQIIDSKRKYIHDLEEHLVDTTEDSKLIDVLGKLFTSPSTGGDSGPKGGLPSSGSN